MTGSASPSNPDCSADATITIETGAQLVTPPDAPRRLITLAEDTLQLSFGWEAGADHYGNDVVRFEVYWDAGDSTTYPTVDDFVDAEWDVNGGSSDLLAADFDTYSYTNRNGQTVYVWTVFPSNSAYLEVDDEYCFAVKTVVLYTETSTEYESDFSPKLCLTVERYRMTQIHGIEHENAPSFHGAGWTLEFLA